MYPKKYEDYLKAHENDDYDLDSENTFPSSKTLQIMNDPNQKLWNELQKNLPQPISEKSL